MAQITGTDDGDTKPTAKKQDDTVKEVLELLWHERQLPMCKTPFEVSNHYFSMIPKGLGRLRKIGADVVATALATEFEELAFIPPTLSPGLDTLEEPLLTVKYEGQSSVFFAQHQQVPVCIELANRSAERILNLKLAKIWMKVRLELSERGQFPWKVNLKDDGLTLERMMEMVDGKVDED